jgi:hypothetical protein
MGAGLIDKAFLIAKPMRKADWTRRFAAGWGSAGVPMAIFGGGQTVRSGSARENDQGEYSRCAQRYRDRVLGGLEDAVQLFRYRRFRLLSRRNYGPPNRGYSPSSRVRQLPQWGHRGNSASWSSTVLRA